MKNLTVAKYCFNGKENRFNLVKTTRGKCSDIPKSFYISKNIKNDKIDANYMMYCKDINEISFKTGIRELRKNVLYGDRWWISGKKSFMILIYVTEDLVELHFFDGFCPENKEERTAFLNYYFNKTGIAKREFKSHPTTWEQKRYRRKNKNNIKFTNHD